MNHQELSEAELVLQLKEGSEKAFELLYRRYSNKVAAFVFPYCNSTEDAQEAVQEAFLAVWLNRATIDPSRSFDNYLLTIAKNFALKIVRKSIQQRLLEQKLALLRSDHETSPSESEILPEDVEKKLDQIVQQLPNRSKQVFLLRRVEGLSNKEIAQQLGISISTVENHINLAISRIRQAFLLSEIPLLFIAFALFS